MKRASLNREEKGFTFVEVFAAMVFLAILVPAIVEGLTIANKASVVAERGSIAGELAENKMNEMLADGTWQSNPASGGDFGTDWPGYRWEMSQESWDQDKVNVVTELDLSVFFQVQGEEHNFELTTLVSGTTQNQTSSSQTSQSQAAQSPAGSGQGAPGGGPPAKGAPRQQPKRQPSGGNGGRGQGGRGGGA